MLKGFIIIVYKLVVIILVNEITVFFGKNIIGADIYFWQLRLMWIFNQKDFFGIEIQVSALLVAQICICIPVANYLTWMFYPDGAMICGDDQL